MSSKRELGIELSAVPTEVSLPDGDPSRPPGHRGGEQIREKLKQKERQLERAKQDAEQRRRRLQEQTERMRAVLSELQDARQEVLSDNEEELVNLSLRIAEKVIGHEIENGRYKVERIVRTALEAAPREQNAVVHLSPRDCAPVRRAVEGDEGGLPDGLTIVEDEDVSPGSCCVETAGGNVTSGVKSRLKQIEEGLLKTPKE